MSSSSTYSESEGRRPGSNVIWWDDGGSEKRRRVGKLLGLQGYSGPETTMDPLTFQMKTEQAISKNFLYNAVASFLASKHFNERRGDILPHLPELLEGCDFYWDYEYRDGQWSELEASRQLLQSIDIVPGANPAQGYSPVLGSDYDAPQEQPQQNLLLAVDSFQVPNVTTTHPGSRKRTRRDLATTHASLRDKVQHLEPFAVYGAYWSRVSKVLSLLSGGLEIPYVTGGSTAAELDGNPLFARTVPNNDGDARAAMVYFREVGIRHVAVLYIHDSWGVEYHASLSRYASQFGITVQSFAYDPQSLPRTMDALKASEHRYIFGIMRDWKKVMREAMRIQIVNRPGYVWIGAEEKKWTGDDFQLEIGAESDLAAALHGVGTINLYFDPVPAYEAAMDEMAHSKELQQEFIAIQAAHPEVFDNYTWPKYDPTGFAKAIFDSVMALGITACNASSNLPPLFTGKEFYQALVETQFKGVSGDVSFDPATGTRIASNVKYSMESVFRSIEKTDLHYHRFDSHLVAVIQGDTVQNFESFIYNDGTTIAPPAIPPIEGVELHLIPPWAMGFAYTFAGIVMIVALICGCWCYVKRNIFILRASQPFFLIQLCAGCFITAAAVFPWALPGSSTVGAEQVHKYYPDSTEVSTLGLNVACMSSLWFGFVGFAMCFSALASKTMRINQILNYGSAFRHATINVENVMMPLYLSLSVNILLLLLITFVSPVRYERIPIEGNVDRFGRSLESYGTCAPANNKYYYFLGALMLTNLIGVAAVTRESYKSRNIPPDFSDRESLARALLSILETAMLGGPILLVVEESPTAFFLVGSSLLSICCLTIMLLIFIPKYLGRNRRHRMQSVVVQIHSAVSQHSTAGLNRGNSNGSGIVGMNNIDDDNDSSALIRGRSQITRRSGNSSSTQFKPNSSKPVGRKQASGKRRAPPNSAMTGSSNSFGIVPAQRNGSSNSFGIVPALGNTISSIPKNASNQVNSMASSKYQQDSVDDNSPTSS